ncbi:MAG: phospholipase D-like domain-containing protein [Thermoplasmata archaeon]
MGFLPNLLLGLVVMLAAFSFVPSQHAPDAAPFASGTRAAADMPLIMINEVMFNPSGTQLDGEWIELRNPGTQPVDVANWTVSDQDGDVDFIFPVMQFPAGGYALIHVKAGTNSTGFINGTAEFFMGKGSAILTNGDDVLLSNSSGATVDFMSYGELGDTNIDPAPPDFNYTHSNASAPEGFSLALFEGGLRASAPTPLYPNGDDSAPPLLLIEVHYSAWGENEFFTVHNPTGYGVDMSSWYLTDLEGKVAFPTGTVIAPGRNITVAQNSTNYRLQTLRVPDFEYRNLNASIADMAIIGSQPELANTDDQLFLLNNFGTQVDGFVYGGTYYTGPGWDSEPAQAVSQGWIAKRNSIDGYVDTNTSADWDSIRPYVIGQSEFASSQFVAPGTLELFASPDSSHGAVSDAIDNAAESIWLTVYEFTSNDLAHHLLLAIARGVEVRLFLEGAPVGGITAGELFIARRIVEAGGQVRIMTNDPANKIYARYSYVHAKYAVIDSGTLMIMSENWGQSGLPLPGTAGNRGWGAIVRDAAVAGYFSEVFLEDWNPERPDSVAFDSSHKLWGAGSNSTSTPQPFTPLFPAKTVTSGSLVIPVLAPDTSLAADTVLGMLASASDRLLVEEFYIYKHWGARASGSTETTPNIYLESVIDAARRGCHVRILLDETFYNAMEDDPIDNDDTVAYVNGIAMAEGLDMEAKLVNLDEHGFEKIHNKGLIADDSVLISSINWNLNSVTRNRESGLIIHNAEAADYFAEIFEYDWIDDLTPPFAHFRANASYQVNTTVRLNATTSSDNQGIVNYSWRIDGQAVCHSLYFNHTFVALGSHAIELTVRDAWGNAGSYAAYVNVTVESPDPDDGAAGSTDDASTGGDPAMVMMIGILLMVPIFIFIAILLVAKLRRR